MYIHHSKHPGKDQNKVVAAMQHWGGRVGSGFGSNTLKFNDKSASSSSSSSTIGSSSSDNNNNKHLNWRFIPVTQAVLIDKLFKFLDQAVELGGEVTARILAGQAKDADEGSFPPPPLPAAAAAVAAAAAAAAAAGGETKSDTADMNFMHQNAFQDPESLGQTKDAFDGIPPPASIVHVTCFERDTKIMGLKAANSYWNPFYYDPRRPTITKKLLAFNKPGRGRRLRENLSLDSAIGDGDNYGESDMRRRLGFGEIDRSSHRLSMSNRGEKFEISGSSSSNSYLDLNALTKEVHALVYLALALDRTLILPNVLVELARGQLKKILSAVDPQKSNVIQRPTYRNNTLWPGFRTLYLHANPVSGESVLPLKMVEPAYYWRVRRDYDIPNISGGKESGTIVPEPIVISFVYDVELTFMEETLASFSHEELPRIVIHMLPPTARTKYNHQQKVYVSKTLFKLSNFREPTETEKFVLAEQKAQAVWAQHSVGNFEEWDTEAAKYQGLPSLARYVHI